MRLRTLAALTLVLSAIGLSGCGLLSEPTVTADEVAEAAADALEEQVGSRPDIDCGDDDAIAVVEGDTVDCVVTDPASGVKYDATVTFSGVDGDTWHADVKVAEEPADGASEPPTEPAEETTSEAPAGDTELTIPAERLAEATADALEEQIGSRPEIDCGDPELNITIYVGRTYYCDLIDPSGSEYGVALDITSIEGNQFEFGITVDEQPS